MYSYTNSYKNIFFFRLEEYCYQQLLLYTITMTYLYNRPNRNLYPQIDYYITY